MNSVGLYETKALCCGCGACMNICNYSAITMKADNNGFVYPLIDDNKCVGCGLCKSVCQYTNPKLLDSVQAFAVSNIDTTESNYSSSGGIFPILAKSIISKQGTVYGASYEDLDQVKNVKHIKIDNDCEIKRLQGSKYVQSDVGYTYRQVKKDLENGQEVLFSGTPCQVSGLKSFLKKEYEKLYTIDIVCHGVPSQEMFKSYIEFLEKRWHDSILEFSFRDKNRGWSDFYIKARLKSGKTKISFSKIHAYYYYFLNADIYRENCYDCPFAGEKRVGDITLGDFWGFEHVNKENMADWSKELSTGISCMLVNSEKGYELFSRIKNNVKYIESTYEKVAKENGQLRAPVPLSVNREELLDIWRKNGYKGLQRYYSKKGGWNFYYIMMKKSISPYIKKILNKKKM